jgi:galactose mutarotase-like enzyme
MTAPRPSSAEPGYVALEGGGARIEVIPSQGGRVRSLRIGGREWLLQGTAATAPQAGVSHMAGAGWDECAPAAGGGTVPEWVKGIGGRAVPPGGEARLQAPEVTLRTTDEGHQLACTWRGERLPWTLTRTLLVRPEGTVEARYEAIATGTHRLPFLWSALMFFPLDSATRIRLPDAARLRVQSVTGAELGGGTAMSAHQWPRLTLDGTLRDLSTPWQIPRKATVTGWVDLGATRAALQLVQGTAKLGLTTDGAGIPHCGVMLDRGGARLGGKRGPLTRGAPPAIAISPALGAPDRYAEALGDWQSITWLVPGEPRRWTMTFRAGM